MLKTDRWYPMLQINSTISPLGKFGSYADLEDAESFVQKYIDDADIRPEIEYTWTVVYLRESTTTRVVPTTGVTRYFINRHEDSSGHDLLLTYIFIRREAADDFARSLNRQWDVKKDFKYTVVVKTFTD